jgi:peptidoglycan/LPS O-acetylase OafA/YrhL
METLNSTVGSNKVESSQSSKLPFGRGRLWRLEAVRGFVALWVLIFHTFNNYLHLSEKPIWGYPFRTGPEAVMIFFILSGFVISYSHPNSSDDFRSYFIKRLRRIYPIFGLALLLAYAVACLGASGWAPVNLTRLLGNLFMLQNIPLQPGVAAHPYADNAPLWSLSYEWWFYMMFFPINRWVPRPAQKFVVMTLVVAGIVVNLFHPNSPCWFLAFFLIWWAGVELAHEFRETGDISLARQKSMLALFALPIAWYAMITIRWLPHAKHFQTSDYPLIDLRFFSMSAVLLLFLFTWRKFRFAGFDVTLGRFKWVGGISYALYVFHYPIICDLRLFSGQKHFYIDLVLRIGLVFILSWLAEGLLQKWINKVTNPLLKRNRPSSMPGAVPA